MSLPVVKSGVLTGGLPFVRLGKGRETLVIFPGLGDALWDVTTMAPDQAPHYERFAEQFTVYVLSRKRHLPARSTTCDMAADCAAAFEHDIGSAHVLGISLGGYIAQHLAADFPQHVRRLVIACAAHRVSEDGRTIPQRWLTLAREQRWKEFYFDMAKVTIREYQQTFYQFLIPLLRKPPADPHDFLVSLEACLTHDSTELLQRIQVPTLVIGGADDIFFPGPLLRETAQRIPNAKLLLIEGTGHGAYELHKHQFEHAVIEFLRGPAGSLRI